MERPVNGSLNPFDGLEDEEDENPFAEPPLCERSPPNQVEHHWRAMDSIVQSKVTDPFSLDDFRKHLTSIEKLIIKEKPTSSGRTGECLEFVLNENIIESVYIFSTRQRVYGKEVRIMLLKFFTEVFARSIQPVLIHQQVLRPLSRLLRACEGTEDQELCGALVPLLHHICILMQENQSLLDLFFIDAKVHLQSKFLIFTQLVLHMHEVSDVGNRARDALLLCLSLAAQLPASSLSRFIAVDCNFCQVLATGLSALYSDLPTSAEITVDEWQSILPVIEGAVPELKMFTQALSFCNSVLQMAPKVVCDTVLTLVREGFLQQVLGPALFQASEDAATFATAYLVIFLSHVSNVALMREFLRYIMVGKYDEVAVLSRLTQNISSSNDKLCAITLELFYVIIDFNCEDVMLELLLRHLLPGNHVMPNQLAIVGAPDIYGQSARRLLQLLPTSCINAEKMFLESIKSSSYSVPSEPPREPTPPPPLTFTSSPSHLDQLEKPSPSRHLILPKPGNGGASGTTPGSNPFDQPFTRSRSGSNASSCSSHSISSGSTAPFTNATTLTSITGTASSFQFEYTPPEMAYFHYLETAREAINTCSMRCRCWSNLYDKCETSKEDLSPSEQLPPKSRELEDVQVRVISEDDVFSNSGNFRSRAVTVSHTRISRTTSLRTNSQLNSRSLQDGKNITSEDSSGLAQSYHLRRTGTVSTSPRTSPRQTRKFSDDSKSRFEDKIGLLLKVLLEKLSEMLKHSPTVNMLLTRLISRLAHFPQPLLRSLLLNHHLVLRPGVPNLLYVLQSIKATIDSYARTRDGFESRLGRARKTMIYRAHVRNSQIEETVASQIVSAEMRRLARVSSRASDLGDILQDSPSPLKKRGSKLNMEGSEDAPPRHRTQTEGGKALAQKARKKKKKKIGTSTLFAIVIFDEFLKELAALAQEHSVASPLLYVPKSVTPVSVH